MICRNATEPEQRMIKLAAFTAALLSSALARGYER